MVTIVIPQGKTGGEEENVYKEGGWKSWIFCAVLGLPRVAQGGRPLLAY